MIAMNERAADYGSPVTHSECVRRTNKRSWANILMSPDERLPATPTKKGGGQGRRVTHANSAASPNDECEAGEVHGLVASHTTPDFPARILIIRDKHVHRLAAERAIIRINNQLAALIRRAMGWRLDLPEKDRNRINRDAAKFIKIAADGEDMPEVWATLSDSLMSYCEYSQMATKPFATLEHKLRSELERMAKQLPVYTWIESICGAGALGLALIVGEAGDLSNYSNPAKLWKRMGLAPKSGYAMECKNGETAYAVPRRRRSISWRVADSLFRKKNPYSELYRERRGIECEKNPAFVRKVDEETGKVSVSKHCDNRARRYAEKRFIRDLWRAWNRQAA
jgi:hypothetical protein